MGKYLTASVCSVNLVIFVLLFQTTGAEVPDRLADEVESNSVARGEVQSCRGCSLKRLPDVRNFIYEDLPKYAGVEFHPIQGAVPHLVLFDNSDKELKRIDLSDLSRSKCNDLVRKWFSLKTDFEENSKDQSREEL